MNWFRLGWGGPRARARVRARRCCIGIPISEVEMDPMSEVNVCKSRDRKGSLTRVGYLWDIGKWEKCMLWFESGAIFCFFVD